MAAPVSFRERSDSFPLHRGRRPYMAHRYRWQSIEFTVGIGGAADMDGHAASAGCDANDPSATLAVHCGNGFDVGLSPIKVLV